MAVGFDTSSESHGGAAAGVRGVLVFTFVLANADDEVNLKILIKKLS